MNESRDAIMQRLLRHGQGHVLSWWPELSEAQKRRQLNVFTGIDLEQLVRLVQEENAIAVPRMEEIRAAPIVRLPATFEDWEREQQSAEAGEQALKAGHVAVLMVAGGQGTRLGHDGPKGTIPIGPVSGKSLFQLHAEKVLALGRHYATAIPFYIMTSPDNDEATRRFFEKHGHFGLDPAELVFFTQGTMPALDLRTGRLLLSAKDQLALSPNGHGGALQALADGGHLDTLERRGIRHLFYFQVDNPLVKVGDPVYLGRHLGAGAEVSLKVVAKTGPREKVGNLVEAGGRLRVIEYSDLPDDLADQRDADGGLRIWAGSIAIHLFDVSFLRRLSAGPSMLPFHRAVKKVPYLNELGELVQPAQANAVKFEMFIFDAIPLAKKALAVETSRAEEFEPVKNADGENSPATAKQALSNLFAEWLNRAGVEVARRPDGAAAVPIEIGPLFALDAEELRDQLDLEGPVSQPLLLDRNDSST